MIELASTVLSLLGIVLLLAGLYEARSLRKTLKTGRLKEAWDKLSVLIVIFAIGYIGFLANMFTDVSAFGADQNYALMVSVVFFLGGLFVLATAYYNKDAFAQ